METEQRIVDYAAEYMVKNGYPPIAEAIKHWQSKQKKGEAR